MKYRQIGSDPATSRTVSVLSLGAMLFGTRTDEKTAYALLDRYTEAGGTFVDTSNNYAYWLDDSQGGASEEVLGRWRRSRGIGDEITIATKLGARPRTLGTGWVENGDGLSAENIRIASEQSRERLGLDRLPLLYAHVQDRATPLAETVEGFAAVVADGTVGLLGVSNHWAWQIERSRAVAAAAGLPGYEVLQYSHSYLRRRTDRPAVASQDGPFGLVGSDLLSYLREEPQLAMVAYTPLLGGGYTQEDRLGPDFDHAGTPVRLAALDAVAEETGATRNQVVLAWLIGAEIPVIPLVGASSVAQLDESLAAVDLELTEEQRARLDGAH
ncbi:MULTISPECIES: aldo/keto reductase [Streptomyces]|uniref:Aldo/keto reductase n=1 Tax=Streptomyces tsukubensis (strain DSM 42081 / NBRC 108919 / NRRL 18488 / 9993) TaxID=1114943 RepID=I2NBQ4_STRT9|nr:MULTISPECIES: aldo/keto reductase [Streptomyces]AZK98143.1 oxidoreductase [Streptomyces tsukubensis]EIF94451.1 putative aldo/keto reductase [Streptomyces tsukubensis NRRL18488]MYS63339.1 aldo/keto reductase [Streptomyces sp. SID5473]QKM65935.1 aldo/keto reductase [Streptomyces tsukubensis NRRL18488]TAI42221.1 aldo/keto reductase [Streptomyces tsukubensis]